MALDYIVVGLIGALTGATELVSRYRDAPVQATFSPPGVAYAAINAGASLAALALARVFGWKFGLEDGDQVRWTQVLVSGFGAMALFRSSLFVVHVAGQDIGAGPSGVLHTLLAATDRGVDRSRARIRISAVRKAMVSISFEKAHVSLPAVCLVLMQNLSPQEQEQLGNEISDLAEIEDMPDGAKAMALGLVLMDIIGEGVLVRAVDALRDHIKLPAETQAERPSGSQT